MDNNELRDMIFGKNHKPQNPLEEYLMKGFDESLTEENPVCAPDDEFIRYLNDLKKNAPPYKFPKDNVHNMSDEELAMEVIDWFSTKITDWDKQYDLLVSLPKPCQYTYVCKITVDEIGNGGYKQLFFNLSQSFNDKMPKVIKIAIEGFKTIGVPHLADMTKKALEIHVKDENDYVILDTEYMGCDQNMIFSMIADYIKLHANCYI